MGVKAIKPILFSGPMVNALLAGQKTQTRRVIRNVRQDNSIILKRATRTKAGVCTHVIDAPLHPYLLPVSVGKGDLLWVRETWSDVNDHGVPAIAYRADSHVSNLMDENDRYCDPDGSFNYNHELIAKYRFDQWAGDLLAEDFGPNEGYYWRPSIFMPRAFSRLTLRVTGVSVERLQSISRGDAMEEGCPHANIADGPSPVHWFHELWDSLNAKRGYGWETNPWVVAYSFELIRLNVSEVL